MIGPKARPKMIGILEQVNTFEIKSQITSNLSMQVIMSCHDNFILIQSKLIAYQSVGIIREYTKN